jgi:hypothetical protein
MQERDEDLVYAYDTIDRLSSSRSMLIVVVILLGAAMVFSIVIYCLKVLR